MYQDEEKVEEQRIKALITEGIMEYLEEQEEEEGAPGKSRRSERARGKGRECLASPTIKKEGIKARTPKGQIGGIPKVPTASKPKAKIGMEPKAFDRTKHGIDARNWLQRAFGFVKQNNTQYPEDHNKIYFIVSCMEGDCRTMGCSYPRRHH